MASNLEDTLRLKKKLNSATEEDWDKMNVTPRSGGYGDATATYIRRSEIPSRIYAKHQYNKNQSTEVRGICLYTFQHKDYKVITERDILVHVHYITARYKSEIYKFV